MELVDGGTLFLDEIGDIDAKVQSLLLRVIQEGEFSRVGEREVRKVNIRFITATHKDIRQMIEQNLFRQDLFFRIVQGEITLPPLRSRLEDLPLLVAHFSHKYFPERSVLYRREFFDQLRTYPWPGNVRELESYVQKVMISWPHQKEFGPAHVLPFLLPLAKPEESIATLDAFLDQQKAAFVFQRLESLGGNRTRTAQSLGIARQSLIKIIERYKPT